MNKIYITLTLIATVILNSCTDVIPVNLETIPPKLVVEANINWQKGTTGSTQTIKLTTTTSFYSNIIPTVSNAVITVKDSNNNVYNFIEKPNTGQYICNSFVPKINETYTLNITYNGNNYTATETLKSVSPIQLVTQENSGGINGKEPIIKAIFNDPAEENFYLFKYSYSRKVKPRLNASDDRFFNGNTFFSNSFNDELEKGEQIDITHYGISKNYYNYMNILINLAGDSGGGPFQTPPVNLRGNITNTTNPDNYPLGYFNLSETDSKTFIVQ